MSQQFTFNINCENSRKTSDHSVKVLRQAVRTALCQTNYQDFNTQISSAHGQVHCLVIEGTMCQLKDAAYDPIFYLHHSNVDRLYAYWQQLQTLRGLTSLTAQRLEGSWVRDFQMPPYTNQMVNPFLELNGRNATQAYGLNYQGERHVQE